MKRHSCLSLTYFLGVFGCLMLHGVAWGITTEERTWSDQNGRQIKAALISYDSSTNTGSFRREEGYVVQIELALLALSDQAYINNLLSQQRLDTDEASPPEETQSERYVFSGIKRAKTNGYIRTKDGWEYQIDSLRVKVRYRGDDAPKRGQYVKAYFYDRHKQLLEAYQNPARLQNPDQSYSNPPKRFNDNQNEEVYFPISEYLEERDWQRAIIVFGDKDEVSARIYPNGDLANYAFAEREMIFGEALKEEGSFTVEGAVQEKTEFRIRSARKTHFNSTAWVDREWKDGSMGILVKVEVANQLPTKEYFLKAHFFDKDNRRLFTVDEPAQIESDDAANVYTKLPKFANTSEDMLAFFPFERRIEASDWRKVIIVFGDEDSVDVSLVGGGLKDLDEFDFPEKALYLSSLKADTTE